MSQSEKEKLLDGHLMDECRQQRIKFRRIHHIPQGDVFIDHVGINLVARSKTNARNSQPTRPIIAIRGKIPLPLSVKIGRLRPERLHRLPPGHHKGMVLRVSPGRKILLVGVHGAGMAGFGVGQFTDLKIGRLRRGAGWLRPLVPGGAGTAGRASGDGRTLADGGAQRAAESRSERPRRGE